MVSTYNMQEYQFLYENGPVSVGLVLTKTQIGKYQGDSANLQLEGILSGETEKDLIFDEINSVNTSTNYMRPINAGESLVKKELVAVIYRLKE